MDFGKKVVLITGASSGIGRACAEAFAQQGSLLAITGRNLERLEETKKKCCELGVEDKNILLLLGDVEDEKKVEYFVDSTVNHFGRIDVLVNNAGMIQHDSVMELGMESFDKIIKVNLRSPFQLSKLCLPHLIKTKGNIVNVSSVAGLKPFTGHLSYCISKAGLDMLTKCIAIETADKGVRVNSVNPGAVATNILVASGFEKEASEKMWDSFSSLNPIKRVGDANEIAHLVLFLASDLSAYTTGATIPIDGGFLNSGKLNISREFNAHSTNS